GGGGGASDGGDWGGPARPVRGNASAAGGGGGSCVTSGTPESGTDLMSFQASPCSSPPVPSAPDVRSTTSPGRGTMGSRESKSSGDATGARDDGGVFRGVLTTRSRPPPALRLATSPPPGPSASAFRSSYH